MPTILILFSFFDGASETTTTTWTAVSAASGSWSNVSAVAGTWTAVTPLED
jgi:hypothetical protein